MRSATKVERKSPRRKATRTELLRILEQNMARFATLKAKANVTVIKQDVLLPASLLDERRMKKGKPYRKKFATVQVNGLLLLSRGPEGRRRVRFSGEIIGPSRSFMLLAKEEKFWVVLPTQQETPDAPRGRVFIGRYRPGDPRPEDYFSIRPQDICDLFLTDEAFAALNGEVICYLEEWNDFYILNFLRPDWPEHIFSKIWFNRDDLTVAIHQLFDRSGRMIAEGRFRDYRRYSRRGSKVEAEIPRRAVLIWPRDSLVIQVELNNIKVNEEIASKYFEPKFPKYYRVEEVRIPAAGRASSE